MMVVPTSHDHSGNGSIASRSRGKVSGPSSGALAVPEPSGIFIEDEPTDCLRSPIMTGWALRQHRRGIRSLRICFPITRRTRAVRKAGDGRFGERQSNRRRSRHAQGSAPACDRRRVEPAVAVHPGAGPLDLPTDAGRHEDAAPAAGDDGHRHAVRPGRRGEARAAIAHVAEELALEAEDHGETRQHRKRGGAIVDIGRHHRGIPSESRSCRRRRGI